MLMIFLFTLILFATGDPYAKITLKPIATKNGEVLFATKSVVNKTGSYSCENEKYGWLVVNNKGAWDEVLAFESLDSECIETNVARHKNYREEKVNLKYPDDALKILMSVYGFDKNTPLKNDIYSVVAIKAHQSCFKGECIDESLKQKTVLGYKSTKLIKPIRSIFYYQGVVLFKNFPSKVKDKETILLKDQGAVFDIGVYDEKFQKLFGVKEPKSSVDGIAFFEPKDFKHAAQTPLKNLKYKVNELKSFYPYCFYGYRTDCFEHTELKVHGFSHTSISYTLTEAIEGGEEENELFIIQNLKSNDFDEKVSMLYYNEFIFKNNQYFKTKRSEEVEDEKNSYKLNWYGKKNIEHSSKKTKKLLEQKLKKYDIDTTKETYVHSFPLNYKRERYSYKIENKKKFYKIHDSEYINKIKIFSYVDGKKSKKVWEKSFKNQQVMAYEVLGYIPSPKDEGQIVLLLSYLVRGWEGVPHVTHIELLSVRLF